MVEIIRIKSSRRDYIKISEVTTKPLINNPITYLYE